MKLLERKIKTYKHVHGKAVGFKIDRIRLPNKKRALREYLDHPGAVGAIPLTCEKKIILVKQYRYPVQQSTWEIPAGKLSKKESPLQCIKRELEEETGYKGKRFKKLISFWPTPAFSNEIIHLFLASGLTKGQPRPDEDEFLECRAWSWQEITQAIRKGTIKDSKTIIALLTYTQFKD